MSEFKLDVVRLDGVKFEPAIRRAEGESLLSLIKRLRERKGRPITARDLRTAHYPTARTQDDFERVLVTLVRFKFARWVKFQVDGDCRTHKGVELLP